MILAFPQRCWWTPRFSHNWAVIIISKKYFLQRVHRKLYEVTSVLKLFISVNACPCTSFGIAFMFARKILKRIARILLFQVIHRVYFYYSLAHGHGHLSRYLWSHVIVTRHSIRLRSMKISVIQFPLTKISNLKHING